MQDLTISMMYLRANLVNLVLYFQLIGKYDAAKGWANMGFVSTDTRRFFCTTHWESKQAM